MSEEKIKKSLDEIDQIIKMAIAQKKLLMDMLGKKDDIVPITVSNIIIEAIDNYIEDKPLSYRREESKSVITLKVIDIETDSAAEVKIIDLDWL